jgi:cytidylate kinase
MGLFRGRGLHKSVVTEKVLTKVLPESESENNPLPSGVPAGDKLVVTIARQCGSGGSEIGRLLARHADMDYLDHEIINEVARRSGVPVEQVASQDEQTTGSLGYMLEALKTSTPFNLNYSKLLQPPTPNAPNQPREQAYLRLTQSVVLEMASAGNAVIIGRGSQFLLRGLPRVLHIYIFAPMPRRIENIMQHLQMTRVDASEFIERRDSETENYLRHYYGANGAQPELYHLLINTGLFSFEEAADLIVQTLPLIRETR